MKPPASLRELRSLLATRITLPPGRLAPAVTLAGGVLLLALIATQTVLILASTTDEEGLGAAGRTEFETPAEATPSPNGQDPFAPTPELARESHPGPLVRELVALLDDSGVQTYRYRVTRHGGADADFTTEDEERWALPPEDEDDGEGLAIDLGSLDDVLGPDAAMMVADLHEWRVALRLEASYADVMSFLSSLTHSGRVWAAPHLSLTEAGHGITANALLLTWTEAGEDFVSAPAASGESGRGARDPFHGLIVDGPPSARLPALPHLGAISHGAEPIAWLDGQRVAEGDRLGSWTVMKIATADVTLLHESGALRTVRGNHDLLPQR